MAKGCSQPGIDATGTKIADANVSGDDQREHTIEVMLTADGDQTSALSVNREQRVLRAALHHGEGRTPVPVQDRASRSDDPDVVTRTPGLEEAG